MRHLRFLLPTCLVSMLALARPSAAQPRAERIAAAETLFDQGRELMEQRRYAEACVKFVESERLDHGLGTLLNLGECYERNGQIASAWATFREVMAMAINENQPDREQIARAREKELRPRLVKLTIAPTAAALVSGLSIERDGVVVDRAMWGVSVPVDPGKHAVRVAAPGKVARIEHVDVPARAGAEIRFEVAPLPDIPRKNAPAAPKQTQRIAGIILSGVGVSGLVVGSALGVKAIRTNAASSAYCLGDRCDATGVDLRSAARTAGDVATGVFIGAAATLMGGAVLYFTAPDKNARATTPRVGVLVSGSGLVVEGRW